MGNRQGRSNWEGINTFSVLDVRTVSANNYLARISDADLIGLLFQLTENIDFLESGEAKIIALSEYVACKELVASIRVEIERRTTADLKRISDGLKMPQEPQKTALSIVSRGKKSRRPSTARQAGRLSVVRRRRRK